MFKHGQPLLSEIIGFRAVGGTSRSVALTKDGAMERLRSRRWSEQHLTVQPFDGDRRAHRNESSTTIATTTAPTGSRVGSRGATSGEPCATVAKHADSDTAGSPLTRILPQPLNVAKSSDGRRSKAHGPSMTPHSQRPPSPSSLPSPNTRRAQPSRMPSHAATIAE